MPNKNVFRTLDFMYKIKYGILSMYLQSKISFVHENHGYQTRNVNNFSITSRNKSLIKNSMFYKGLIMYNNLPIEIRIYVCKGNF